MKLTISDIAKKAGVSRSTVSRVLTNNPNVNDETRAKIKSVIEESEYQPSSIARGLSLGRVNIIALIIEDIRNPFYSELTWVIERILSKNGYIVVLCDTEYNPEKEILYLKTAKQYGFAGVVMISAMESSSLISILGSIDCPVVLLNRYLKAFEGDVVVTDNFQGGYLATRHLIELGHNKIGMLTGPLDFSTHSDRHRGYKSALEAFNIDYREEYVVQSDLKMQGGYEYGLSLLEMGKNRPTAVFASNDLMAIGIMEAFKKNGLSVPEGLSIIGFDDIPIASTVGINLTTIRHPYNEIGEKAVELILTKINRKDEQNKKVIFSPKLIIRGSTSQIGE